MKILVTGGAGFVGSHLIPELGKLGHQVTVLDNFSTSSRSLSHRSTVSAEIVDGSIMDEPLISSLIKQADQVVHLAAAVGVANIVESPLRGLQTNVIGSEIVIRNCAKYAKPILLTSSSEIYGKNDNGPLNEVSDRIIGVPQKQRWSYSDSKAIEESFAIAYSKEAGLQYRIVRLFNTVGPGQRSEFGMVIPRFIEAAMRNKPLEVYGDGSQKRCFMHVKDAVTGLISILESPLTINEVYNLGNPEETSIYKLARKILEISSSSSTVTFREHVNVFGLGFEDMLRRVPDISKVRRDTGWTPSLGLDQIIKESIAEFLSNSVN